MAISKILDNNLSNGISDTATVILLIITRKLHIVDLLRIILAIGTAVARFLLRQLG